jgi:hypothetical protein
LHSDGICAARTPLHVRRHGKPAWCETVLRAVRVCSTAAALHCC